MNSGSDFSIFLGYTSSIYQWIPQKMLIFVTFWAFTVHLDDFFSTSRGNKINFLQLGFRVRLIKSSLQQNKRFENCLSYFLQLWRFPFFSSEVAIPTDKNLWYIITSTLYDNTVVQFAHQNRCGVALYFRLFGKIIRSNFPGNKFDRWFGLLLLYAIFFRILLLHNTLFCLSGWRYDRWYLISVLQGVIRFWPTKVSHRRFSVVIIHTPVGFLTK